MATTSSHANGIGNSQAPNKQTRHNYGPNGGKSNDDDKCQNCTQTNRPCDIMTTRPARCTNCNNRNIQCYFGGTKIDNPPPPPKGQGVRKKNSSAIARTVHTRTLHNHARRAEQERQDALLQGMQIAVNGMQMWYAWAQHNAQVQPQSRNNNQPIYQYGDNHGGQYPDSRGGQYPDNRRGQYADNRPHTVLNNDSNDYPAAGAEPSLMVTTQQTSERDAAMQYHQQRMAVAEQRDNHLRELIALPDTGESPPPRSNHGQHNDPDPEPRWRPNAADFRPTQPPEGVSNVNQMPLGNRRSPSSRPNNYDPMDEDVPDQPRHHHPGDSFSNHGDNERQESAYDRGRNGYSGYHNQSGRYAGHKGRRRYR